MARSASIAAAQTVTLPTDGYFRPGRYFPIAVKSAQAESAVVIESSDIVPLRCDRIGTRAIIPVLSIGPAAGLLLVNGRASEQPLRPLSLHDSLVGIVGDSRSAEIVGKAIFPGSHVIAISLDPADPLPGLPLAWQSLDAVVLTGGWPGGLKLEHLGDWLAGGMTVAVVGADPPDRQLPWRPIVGGWVLRPNIAGPLGCDGNADAYLPSGMWHPDWPAALRVQIVGGAVAFSIVLLGVVLLPPGVRMPACVSVATIAMVLITVVHQRQLGTFRASGALSVTRAGWSQQDSWSYLARRRTGFIDVPITGVGWPVFIDPAESKKLNVTMWFTNGQMHFQADLPADHRLGFVQRTVRPADVGALPAGGRDPYSPMGRLARALYRDAGEPMGNGDSAPVATDEPDPVWPSVRCASRE